MAWHAPLLWWCFSWAFTSLDGEWIQVLSVVLYTHTRPSELLKCRCSTEMSDVVKCSWLHEQETASSCAAQLHTQKQCRFTRTQSNRKVYRATHVVTWNRTCNPVQNFLAHIKAVNSDQSHGISYFITKKHLWNCTNTTRFISTQTNTLQRHQAFTKTALTVTSICSDNMRYNTAMSCRRLEVSTK